MNVYKFGFKFYKKYIPLAILCQLVGFFSIFLALILPQLVEILIDTVISGKAYAPNLNIFDFILAKITDRQHMLYTIASTFLVILVFKDMLIYARNNLMTFVALRIERQLRQVTYNRLVSQSSLVLSRYSTGDLLTILNVDIIHYKEIYTLSTMNILDQIFYILTSIYFLQLINPLLAIIPFVIVPVLTVMLSIYMKKARKVSSVIRDASAELSMNVQENINGVRIVRSFANEKFEVEKFEKRNLHFKQSYFKHAELSSKFTFLINLIKVINYFGSFFVGGILVMQDVISTGELVKFLTYVTIITDATNVLVTNIFNAQQFLVSGNRIATFVKTGNIIDDCENPLILTQKPNFSLQNFSISIEGQTILKNINLDIPYGKKIGIMGGTGSGKTVLLKSLMRLYECTSGHIFLNEQTLSKYSLHSVRSQFSYVFQDVFLFSNTITSNIAFYDLESPFEEVEKYAKMSLSNSFVEKLPQKYDTIVGERGVGLSGGQKQRIAIARALIKNANILVFDDSTSALDSKTEKELLSSIKDYAREKTFLITAHRVSSVLDCDEIIYLQDGEIIERGTVSELLALDGVFASIYKKQLNYIEQE